MCVKCILLTLYVNRLSVCVLCGLTPVESMSARGMRPFCRMVMMRATIVDRFFHNRVFKISRYCKILGCYLYLCRQIAYFFNNASCARQNARKLLLRLESRDDDIKRK